MGVYSSAAAEQLKSASVLENFKFTNLLEFACSTERNNQNMFNALIELDFREAVENMNGSILTEANEGQSTNRFKAIIDKTIEALKKFGEIIITAIKKLIIRFQEFFKLNDALVVKIGDLDSKKLNAAMDSLNAEDSDIEFTKFVGKAESFSETLKKIDDLKKEYRRQYTKTGNLITFNSDIAEADKAAKMIEAQEEFVKDSIDTLKKADYRLDDETVSKMFEKQFIRKYINDNNYVSELKGRISGGFNKLVKELSATVEASKKQNDQDIADLKGRMNNYTTDIQDGKSVKVKKEVSDTIARQNNAEYKYFNAMNAQYCKLLSQIITITVNWMTYDRAAYAKLGSIVKKAEKKAKNESFVFECMAIDLANEQFMNTIFA